MIWRFFLLEVILLSVSFRFLRRWLRLIIGLVFCILLRRGLVVGGIGVRICCIGLVLRFIGVILISLCLEAWQSLVLIGL